MSGTRELSALLATMNPALADDQVVFCTVADAGIEDTLHLSPLGVFVEAEGITLILRRATAEQHGLAFDVALRAITLTVHSSLEAVGLTAAVTSRLARHGISANVVAAYHHDHLFVPAAQADRALEILQALQAEAVSRR